MIKVQAIEDFTLKDFDKIKNIQRRNREEYGRIFIYDKFECDKELCDYLLGNNKLNKSVVRVIEIDVSK